MNNGSATDYVVWSDGSCLGNLGPGGYAAIVLHGATGLEHAVVTGSEDVTTNQQMELTAATMGLSRVPLGHSVTVHTDSNYVVDGMTVWIHGWIERRWIIGDGSPVANREHWQRLLDECQGRVVEWNHVRGHNEMTTKVEQLTLAATRAVMTDR